jgi:hypothetical protein
MVDDNERGVTLRRRRMALLGPCTGVMRVGLEGALLRRPSAEGRNGRSCLRPRSSIKADSPSASNAVSSDPALSTSAPAPGPDGVRRADADDEDSWQTSANWTADGDLLTTSWSSTSAFPSMLMLRSPLWATGGGLCLGMEKGVPRLAAAADGGQDGGDEEQDEDRPDAFAEEAELPENTKHSASVTTVVEHKRQSRSLAAFRPSSKPGWPGRQVQARQVKGRPSVRDQILFALRAFPHLRDGSSSSARFTFTVKWKWARDCTRPKQNRLRIPPIRKLQRNGIRREILLSLLSFFTCSVGEFDILELTNADLLAIR